MFSLLFMIYLAFISLGLPDTVLGAAWPSMQPQLGVNLSFAGILSMIISIGTISSSFLSGYFIKRYSSGLITLVSVGLTAVSLLWIGLFPSVASLIIVSVFLGFGGGNVDVALNHFVSKHYDAKHMNWLHSFWGIGATAGPMLISLSLILNQGWQGGYLFIGLLQLVFVYFLYRSLPKFKAKEENSTFSLADGPKVKQKHSLSSGLAKLSLTAFFLYCAMEATAGLYGASYLYAIKGVSKEMAAIGASLYYAGITLGRIFSGFASMKYKNQSLIEFGMMISGIGVVLVMVLPTFYSIAGFILIGIGLAPIYPALIHETPKRFDHQTAASLLGKQMGFAYIGVATMPFVFSRLLTNWPIEIFGPYVFFLFLLLTFSVTAYNQMAKRRKPNEII